MRKYFLLPLVLLALCTAHPALCDGNDVATDGDGNQFTLVQVVAASEKKPMVLNHKEGGRAASRETHALRLEGALSVKDPRNTTDPRVVAVSAELNVERAEDAKGQSLLARVMLMKPRDTWLAREAQEVPLKSRELRLTAPADRVGKLILVARAVRAVKEETVEVTAAASSGWTKVSDGLSVRVKDATVDRRNKGVLRLEYRREGDGATAGGFIRRVDWLNANGIAVGGNTWTGGEGPLAREGVFASEAALTPKTGEAPGVSKLQLTVVTKAEEVAMKFELGGVFAR